MAHLSDDDRLLLARVRERRLMFDEFLERRRVNLKTCPGCGYPSISERAAYEICCICDWEDDGQDDQNADVVVGGPNGKLSLTQNRLNIEKRLVDIAKKTNQHLNKDPAQVVRILNDYRDKIEDLFGTLQDDAGINDPVFSKYENNRKNLLKKLVSNVDWTGYKVSSTTNIILFILFLASTSLAAWAATIYRLTVVPLSVTMIVLFAGGIVGSFLLYLWGKKQIGLIWTVFIGFCTGGFIPVFILLFANSRIQNGPPVTERFQIIETGRLAKSRGCGAPYAFVSFHGQQKQLVFFCEDDKLLKRSNAVELTYYNGGLGYPYIIETKIISNTPQ